MAAGADAPHKRPYDPLHRTQEERQPLLPPLGFTSSSSNEDQGRPAEEQEEERKAREDGPSRLPLMCSVAIVFVLVLAAAVLWLYPRPRADAGGASLAVGAAAAPQAVGVAAAPQASSVAAEPHGRAALLQVVSASQQLAAAPLEVAAIAARAAEAAGRSPGSLATKQRGGPATLAARERRRGPTAALLDAGVAGMSTP